MDEFFEIRVAGLKEQMRANSAMRSPDGLTRASRPTAGGGDRARTGGAAVRTVQQGRAAGAGQQDIHFLRRTQWNDGARPRGSATTSSAN
jgi:polyphosphate kinase